MIRLFFVWNWFLFMRQIGEVVDGPGNLNDRPALNGQHYDYGNYFRVLMNAGSYTYLPKSLCINQFMIWYWVHIPVFDVDIGDGMPIRKLPYNREGQPSRWWWHWNCFACHSWRAYIFDNLMCCWQTTLMWWLIDGSCRRSFQWHIESRLFNLSCRTQDRIRQ